MTLRGSVLGARRAGTLVLAAVLERLRPIICVEMVRVAWKGGGVKVVEL